MMKARIKPLTECVWLGKRGLRELENLDVCTAEHDRYIKWQSNDCQSPEWVYTHKKGSEMNLTKSREGLHPQTESTWQRKPSETTLETQIIDR